LNLDHDRAIERLLSGDLFTVQFDSVWRILEAFNKSNVKIPRERILSIIAAASQEPLEFPLAYVLREALPLLAMHRHEADLALFERLVDHDNKDVSRGATKALYRYHRFAERIRKPWDVVAQDGWDILTSAEKHICAIETLDGEVRNGGFAQYFFNSSGDLWQDAHSGLAAIGAKQRHELMSASIGRFGHSQPSADRGIRVRQLSEIVRDKEDPFHELDQAWYAIKDENLDRLIFKYNMAHLEGRDNAKSSNGDGAE
jgi:hypothetical protein